MKVLLIGASSYVGARLYFDLQSTYDIVGTYSSHQLSHKFIQLNITKKEFVEHIVAEYKPEIIIHAANNASAKWCEAHPDEAILLNQTATQYIMNAANGIHAKLIYISTMGVINSPNMYGKTKRQSEEFVQKTKAGWLILRPSLILGYSPNTTNDRPFNRILKNLDEGSQAVYDTSWKFQPTYIKHISDVIETCIRKEIWGKSIIIAAPEMKSRYDTARDILTPFGIHVTPVDAKDSTFETFEDDLSELHTLNLPQYSYRQMIQIIVEEIKNRKKFIISS